MASELISVQTFENRIKHIISGEFSDGQEFEAAKVLEILLFTYRTSCGYEELIIVLDKLVDAERLLICLIPKQRYKIKPKLATAIKV